MMWRFILTCLAIFPLPGSPGTEVPSENRSASMTTSREVTSKSASDPKVAKAIRSLNEHGIRVAEMRKGGETYLSVTTNDAAPLRSIDDDAAEGLTGLSNVRLVHLYQTKVGDATLERIAKAHVDTLRVLSVHRTRITDRGVAALSGCQKLEQLTIYGNNLTDESLRVAGGLKELRHLYIGGTKITDEGLKRIKGLDKLEWLMLMHTDITDEGLETLHGLKDLTYLNVGGTKVTEAGLARLRTALPNLRIDMRVEDISGKDDDPVGDLLDEVMK
jgi:hypothetical protein